MSDHRITWTLERDSVHGTFHCDAPADAECRSYADPKICGCELMSPEAAPPAPDGSRRWRHLAYDPAADDDVWHEHDRTGSCSKLVWFDDLTAQESYCGDETPPRDGPIKFEWDGEGYDWCYADEQRAAQREGSDDQ